MASTAGSGRRSHPGAVITLSVAYAAAGGWITLSRLTGLAAAHAPFHVPWWALVPAFVGTEIFVINVERGRETHAFSMVEIPMVAGRISRARCNWWSPASSAAASRSPCTAANHP